MCVLICLLWGVCELTLGQTTKRKLGSKWGPSIDPYVLSNKTTTRKSKFNLNNLFSMLVFKEIGIRLPGYNIALKDGYGVPCSGVRCAAGRDGG